MGFPIRISTDQCLLAAPHGFSQRATSFIASQCQGIHQMPLRRLISLRRHAQGQAQLVTAVEDATDRTRASLPRNRPVLGFQKDLFTMSKTRIPALRKKRLDRSRRQTLCSVRTVGGPGGDLLSHVLRRSTIGADGFHGRVRDGIGCVTRRYDHQIGRPYERPGEPGPRRGHERFEKRCAGGGPRRMIAPSGVQSSGLP